MIAQVRKRVLKAKKKVLALQRKQPGSFLLMQLIMLSDRVIRIAMSPMISELFHFP